MKFGMYEIHHRSRSKIILGVADGKMRSVLMLQTSQGCGWTVCGQTEKRMVTCRPICSWFLEYANARFSLYLRPTK